MMTKTQLTTTICAVIHFFSGVCCAFILYILILGTLGKGQLSSVSAMVVPTWFILVWVMTFIPMVKTLPNPENPDWVSQSVKSFWLTLLAVLLSIGGGLGIYTLL